MNNFILFQYSGNLFIKTLEKYVIRLKKKISKHLDDNELQRTKEIIIEIESIRKFQKEIRLLLKKYLAQFPEEKQTLTNPSTIKQSEKKFKHYTFEIMEMLVNSNVRNIFILKESIYDEICTHISSIEISNNEKFPGLLNWEVDYYKSICFLFSKDLIGLDEDLELKLTEKGRSFYGKDIAFMLNEYEDENQNKDEEISNDEPLINKIIESENDEDLISSIRSYLISNLIADEILQDGVDADYYEDSLYIIKNIYSLDGLLIEKWEEIKENNIYVVNPYFTENQTEIFLQKKIEGYNLLECIDQDNCTVYYAFIKL